MRLTRILRHLFFGGDESGYSNSDSKDQPKATDSRMYRVVAEILEIPKEPDDPGIIISPRRVLDLRLPKIVPITRPVRLRFIEVIAGCIKPVKGLELPNLLLENPNILKPGWYDVSVAFLPNLAAGQTYNGVVLVHPSRGIKTFTPSPRNTFVVPDNVVGVNAGLMS